MTILVNVINDWKEVTAYNSVAEACSAYRKLMREGALGIGYIANTPEEVALGENMLVEMDEENFYDEYVNVAGLSH